MMNQGYKKYKPFTPIDLPDRQWPSRRLEKARGHVRDAIRLEVL